MLILLHYSKKLSQGQNIVKTPVTISSTQNTWKVSKFKLKDFVSGQPQDLKTKRRNYSTVSGTMPSRIPRYPHPRHFYNFPLRNKRPRPTYIQLHLAIVSKISGNPRSVSREGLGI